jgi:hypothetical protein
MLVSCGGTPPVEESTRSVSQRVEVAGGPEIVAVNWGSVNQDLVGIEDAFYQDLIRSSYLDQLNEYGVHTFGTKYQGQWSIQAGDQSTTMSWAGIKNMLEIDINNGTLPFPDNDTIYAVHLPPSVTTLWDPTGARACAFHQNWNMSKGGLSYQNVNVAVISDMNTCYSPQGYFYNTVPHVGLGYIHEMTFAMSHEVLEAATDADGNHNKFRCNISSSNNEEVGDCCDAEPNIGNGPQYTTFQGTDHPWFVQRLWSNSHGTCSPYLVPTANTPSAMQSSSAAVSRSPGNIDVFPTKFDCTGTGPFPICMTDLENDYWYAGQPWGQTRAGTGLAGQLGNGSSVAAITINSSYLDTYYFDIYGRVAESWWSAGGTWQSYPLAPSVYGGAPYGGALAAVAPSQSTESVFHLGHEGANIVQYFWQAGASAWQTREIPVPPAAFANDAQNLAAVARTSDNIDLFFVGDDGNLWTAFTYNASQGVSAKWWGPIALTSDKKAQPWSPIAAVARTWADLDVYYFQNGEPMVASWSAGSFWKFQIAYFATPAPVAANGFVSMVARTPFNLDAYYIDTNGQLEWSSWTLNESPSNQFGIDFWNTSPAAVSGGPARATGLLGATVLAPPSQTVQVFFEGSDGANYEAQGPSSKSTWTATKIP